MDFLSNPQYLWFILGIILLILEIAIPGLFILFFGIGAILTSIITWIFNIPISIQLTIFLISSIFGLIIFRKYLKKILFTYNSQNKEVTLEQEFIGKHAIADTDFEANHTGKIIFKGAPWSARSSYFVKKGEEVIIIAKDNITLIVEPIKN